jgi:hypothetical protein
MIHRPLDEPSHFISTAERHEIRNHQHMLHSAFYPLCHQPCGECIAEPAQAVRSIFPVVSLGLAWSSDPTILAASMYGWTMDVAQFRANAVADHPDRWQIRTGLKIRAGVKHEAVQTSYKPSRHVYFLCEPH